MRVVSVTVRDANHCVDLVKELIAQGLKQGPDFDFKYNPAYTYGRNLDNRTADFVFYSEKYSTLFALKYS